MVTESSSGRLVEWCIVESSMVKWLNRNRGLMLNSRMVVDWLNRRVIEFSNSGMVESSIGPMAESSARLVVEWRCDRVVHAVIDKSSCRMVVWTVES